MSVVNPFFRAGRISSQFTSKVFPAMRHVILILTLALLSASLQAAPKPQLWERWQQHDPSSMEVVDHSLWQQFQAKNALENLEKEFTISQ